MIGSSGRRGDEVRSDAWVEIEPRGSGGLELSLRSRVDAYYGASIRTQVEERLSALGLPHARVTIEDQGALPFVLDARLEAAARRAGIVVAARAASASPSLPSVPPRDRLRRSRLYLPGNEPKFLINAGLYRPDGVILDLEDSVHPDEKDAARLLVRNALHAVDFLGAERMVRINQLPLGLEDIAAVAPEGPEVILVPKVESAATITEVDEALTCALGPNAGAILILPILESALGIEHAFAIASASPRVVALTLGLEDYAADLCVPRSPEGHESYYARLRVVNAARAAGVAPIDSVYGQVDDLEGLARWGERSRALGFVGMGCIHPRQIAVIHAAFAPTAAEIERAERIVAAWEAAQAAGSSVVSLGSKMIDPPVVRQAATLVAQARRTGRLPA
jgi:citrate lyase subunit beta/citryl-CoA lyase